MHSFHGKSCNYTKRKNKKDSLSLALFLYISLFFHTHTLPLLFPISFAVSLCTLCHCQAMGYYLHKTVLSTQWAIKLFSHLFGGRIRIILNRTKKKSSSTTSVTFVPCALIGGLLVSFVVPPQMTQQYFWKTVPTMESPVAWVFETLGLTMVGLVSVSITIMKPFFAPWPAQTSHACTDWSKWPSERGWSKSHYIVKQAKQGLLTSAV